ncbi:Uncharacterized protein Adt_19987 [Abeliophyllum distichum]|uniref:Uncharacterized protein n=1 Tax=Abeliophyllum distichum TaxID=126358 RepID=A0ABD1SUH0_9LAMI
MEIISNPLNGTLSKRQQRRRRGYNRSTNRKNNMKTIQFGGATTRSWRFRLTPKLGLKMASPLKLWFKLKNAYMNVMLKLATNSGTSKDGNIFGAKRIPKVRQVPTDYSRTEFDNRLIHEIYKSMVASMELSSTTTR